VCKNSGAPARQLSIVARSFCGRRGRADQIPADSVEEPDQERHRRPEAKPAPWSKPRTLSKADAPYLEYGVDFVDGAVKGPAPLACVSAKYSSGVTYLNEAFGGRLVGDKGAAMVQNNTNAPTGLLQARSRLCPRRPGAHEATTIVLMHKWIESRMPCG